MTDAREQPPPDERWWSGDDRGSYERCILRLADEPAACSDAPGCKFLSVAAWLRHLPGDRSPGRVRCSSQHTLDRADHQVEMTPGDQVTALGNDVQAARGEARELGLSVVPQPHACQHVRGRQDDERPVAESASRTQLGIVRLVLISEPRVALEVLGTC